MSEGELILDTRTQDLFANADAMAKASLKPPQRVQVATELHLDGEGIPPIEELTDKIRKSLKRRGARQSAT
jgi:hypothetical protein